MAGAHRDIFTMPYSTNAHIDSKMENIYLWSTILKNSKGTSRQVRASSLNFMTSTMNILRCFFVKSKFVSLKNQNSQKLKKKPASLTALRN